MGGIVRVGTVEALILFTWKSGVDAPVMAKFEPPENCAAGRKSWLFAGSDRGGERAAVMLTLIQTAKLNDIDSPSLAC
jgi:hypothetical protein